MPKDVETRTLIDRLSALAPNSRWVEPLVRALGCDCPSDVFEQIGQPDPAAVGCGALLAIGEKLLVGFAGAERHEQAEEMLDRGRTYRDAHGFNRFRLVFVGPLSAEQLGAAQRLAATEHDERAHVHQLDSADLARHLAGAEVRDEPSARPAPSSTTLRRLQILERAAHVRDLLERLPSMVMILDADSRVLAATDSMTGMMGYAEADVLGFLPGDILGCSHASAAEGGCGTARFCTYCDATAAIRAAHDEGEAVRECRICASATTQCLDLRITAAPLELEGEAFTICTIEDISHEKRRRALEGVFFHDVSNTASAVITSAGVLKDDVPNQHAPLAEDVLSLARRLHMEIASHKLLLAAETGSLALNHAAIDSLELLEGLRREHENLEIAADRPMTLSSDSQAATFVSDSTLVYRVLANMLRNALEATQPGQEVVLGTQGADDGVTFWVWNATHMPPAAQAQVFQRSFSTKGTHRGLGTYSMKLLGERYLGGRVSFDTSAEAGTTFRIWYPLKPGCSAATNGIDGRPRQSLEG